VHQEIVIKGGEKLPTFSGIEKEVAISQLGTDDFA
jgi:hypothetical protein